MPSSLLARIMSAGSFPLEGGRATGPCPAFHGSDARYRAGMPTEDQTRDIRAEMEDISLHDARLEQMTMLPGGDLLFRFKHIDTYHTDASGHREVWSSRAVLKV